MKTRYEQQIERDPQIELIEHAKLLVGPAPNPRAATARMIRSARRRGANAEARQLLAGWKLRKSYYETASDFLAYRDLKRGV